MPKPLSLRPPEPLQSPYATPSTPSPYTPMTPGFFYRQHASDTPLLDSFSPNVWRRLPSGLRRRGPLATLLVFITIMALYILPLRRSIGINSLPTVIDEQNTPSSPHSNHHPAGGGESWWTTPPNMIQPSDINFTRTDGRILVLPKRTDAGYSGRKHPIPELIRLGKLKWQEKLDSQSKSFKETIQEYKRRYGRTPPKGFDKWYAWARENNVQLIDEYDLIEHDLHTLRAFSPASFRARVEYCENYFTFGWRLIVQDGDISRAGQSKDHDRAKTMERLIRPFAKYLPDMSMWVNGHDTAAIWRSWEETDRLNKLVAEEQYEEDDNGRDISQKTPRTAHPAHPWIATCPPDSAMRQPGFDFGSASKDPSAPYVMPELPPGSIGTFIGHDMQTYMDVCNSPQYRHTHSGTSWTFPIPGPHCAIMTAGVHGNFGDVRAVIPEQWDMKNPPQGKKWIDRTDDRLVWRGQTSGPVWTQQWPYLCSHRARLHLLSHQTTGSRTFLLADPNDHDSIIEKTYSNEQLNPAFLDTGMVGPPVQCVREDGTCDKMHEQFNGFDEKLTLEEQDNYKYVLDVDGNSWSGRFKRLMASDAAVLKATIFPEPWHDWIMPWVHYIPIQVDYSDLWNVLAFFRGQPGDGFGAHDDLADEIARNGKKWQEKYYRWEDLQSYQFRLLLEWGRLYNDGDMDYHGDGSDGEPGNASMH